MTWDSLTLVLAQDTAGDRPASTNNTAPTGTSETTSAPGGQTPIDPNAGGGQPPASPPSLWIWLLPLALVFIMLSMGGRKEKKKHAALMAALGKGDKIRTIGGVLGTVVEVRDDEIVVKVDENTNSRLRFARSAIAAIVEPKSAD
ncbi:MAG: preprotein translocase subunit YajC [Phycisphaerales bacterium]